MSSVLLTVLGVGDYRLVRWRRAPEGPEHETRYAPVATAALVGDISDGLVLLTGEARARHWEACRAELERLGVTARPVDIPVGGTEEEIWAIFSGVVGAASGVREVVVDVTHSFRHLPFVLFGSLSYLTALRGVRVRGVYYGAFEARADGQAPLLDLGALLSLGEWSYAVRSFRETGNARWLARVLTQERGPFFRQHGPFPDLFDRLKSGLKDLSWALPAGLPLESGMHALAALDAVNRLELDARTPAPVRPLLVALRDTLGSVAVGHPVEQKSSVTLDRTELARQLRLAESYHRWGQDDRALLVLREWIINRCLLAAGRLSGRWLEYGEARQPIERALNALVERQKLAPSGSPQRESPLASLWQRIVERRNAIAHAGFRPEWVKESRGVVEDLLQQGERRCDDTVWRTAPPGAGGRVLLTALGKSPGVLFTALLRLEPDRVLVVTSPEASALVCEACQRAGWDANRATSFVVNDAHACFAEVTLLLDWARPELLGAREVLVNLTGGTTAMQYLAERIAGEAVRLGIPTQRYALVDRREPEEQRRQPYVLGECVPLRGDESSDEG